MVTSGASKISKTAWLPASAVACLIYSAIASILVISTVCAGQFAPREQTQDPDEVWHARTALLLICSACLSEICLLSVSCGDHQQVEASLSLELQLHGFGDSLLTIGQYIVKATTAFYMYTCAGGVMHTDAQAFGGERRVYLARYAQWSVAVPLFILIGNRCFLNTEPVRVLLGRCGPAMSASFLFCWTAWLMQLTPMFFFRWALFAAAMIGSILVVVDQFVLVAEQYQEGSQIALKISVVTYQAASMFVYGAVYTLGRFGMISSHCEQIFFAYGDSSICIIQGALLSAIRHKETLQHMQRLFAEARMAKDDLDNVIRRACVPVFQLDLQGRITVWNASLEALTGLSIDDVRGQRLVDLVSADFADSVKGAIANALVSTVDPADGEVVKGANHVEMMIPTTTKGKSGAASLRHLCMNLVVQSRQDLGITGIVGIGNDISELAEMKSMQLKKSALMAMLSHEIRSPLHGILGLTESMLKSERHKENRQLNMVKGCAARLLDLVTNIMELAQNEKRSSEGKQIARPKEPVDFALIAHEVTTMSKMAMDKSSKSLVKPTVELINKCAEQSLPIVPGCPHKCTQLLYNLVTNACKFTMAGSVTISAVYLQDAQRLEVSVTDTGRGISPEGQKRIFQPFEQESENETRGFQGIGLGLAVCSEVCNLLGGDMRVESELGKGSTFTISLPCDGSMGYGVVLSECKSDSSTSESLKSTARSSATAASEAPAPPAGRQDEPTLVLSVDDDEVNQEVVRTALRGLCEVHCVMGGREALQYLDDRLDKGVKMPSALLVDCYMPGMDGFELLQELKHRFERIKMPVLMVSASTPAQKAQLGSYTSASTDFVQKPFHPDILRAKVQAALAIKEDFTGASVAWAVDAAATKVRAVEAEKAALDRESSMLQREVQNLRDQLQRFQADFLQQQQAAAPVLDEKCNSAAVAVQDTEHYAMVADPQLNNDQELHATRLACNVILSRLDVVNKVAKGGQQLLDFAISSGSGADEDADWKFISYAQQQVAQVVFQQLQALEHLTERQQAWWAGDASPSDSSTTCTEISA